MLWVQMPVFIKQHWNINRIFIETYILSYPGMIKSHTCSIIILGLHHFFNFLLSFIRFFLNKWMFSIKQKNKLD